jgi:integrase
MSWALTYRVAGAGAETGTRVTTLSGSKRRLSLGEYPTVSLSDARRKATDARRLAREGIDPAGLRSPKAEPTVADLLERYDREHLSRNVKAGRFVALLLQRHVLPGWGAREVRSIARSDLIKLLEEVRQPRTSALAASSRLVARGGPGSAAEVRKWCRAMFQFAVDAQLLTENPLANVRNRDRQTRRDRVLSMRELCEVWQAAGDLGYPWGPFFRLLLLTGDRRGEWANARLEWFDADRTRLEIPAEHYKTGKPQVVPLSRQARALLDAVPRPELGPFLFTSTGGIRPVSGFSKAKARLDSRLATRSGSAFRDWVIHDLRRSMATHMERIGIEPHVIEVCLGHTLRGVAGTYRHYSYLPEKTAALQRWADELVDAEALASIPRAAA